MPPGRVGWGQGRGTGLGRGWGQAPSYLADSLQCAAGSLVPLGVALGLEAERLDEQKTRDTKSPLASQVWRLPPTPDPGWGCRVVKSCPQRAPPGPHHQPLNGLCTTWSSARSSGQVEWEQELVLLPGTLPFPFLAISILSIQPGESSVEAPWQPHFCTSLGPAGI